MHFTANRKTLLSAVEKSARGVDKKVTIPILHNVLIDALPDGLRITGTDLETAILTRVALTPDETGRTTVDAALLVKALKGFDSDTVTVSADIKHLSVSAGRAKVQLNTISAESYPELPEPSGKPGTLPARMFCEAIRKVTPSISLEKSRFTCGAALMQWNGSFRLTATDGHRLAEYHSDATGPETKALLRLSFLLQCGKLFEKSETLTFSRDEDHAFVTDGDVLVLGRLEKGNFPDIERVIPPAFARQAVCDSGTLKAAIKRALPFADVRSHCLHITLASGELRIVTGRSDEGQFSESIPVEYTGDEFTQGMNGEYLADFLGTVNGAVSYRANNPDQAASLTTGNGFDYLVMPMRI